MHFVTLQAKRGFSRAAIAQGARLEADASILAEGPAHRAHLLIFVH